MEHVMSYPVGDGLYVVMRIRTGWLAVGFYMVVEGGLHLVDLSVVPGEPPDLLDLPPFPEPGSVHGGTWIQDFNYLRRARDQRLIESTKPPQAVYSVLLRQIKLDEMQAIAETHARGNVEFNRELGRRHPALVQSPDPLDGIDDLTAAKLDYLRAASRFVAMNDTDSNEAIAQMLGITPNQLRDHLNAARKHGYLTSVGRGRRGGELTELGQLLVTRHLRRKR